MIDKTRFEQGYTFNEMLQNYPEQLELHQHHYNKTVIHDDDRNLIQNAGDLNIMVLTIPWCGDSVATLPVLFKLVEGLENVKLRILERDDHPDIMDNYLTNGGRAVPKFVFFDGELNELGNWGPRPKPFQEIFEQYRPKIKSGEISKETVHQILRKEYAKDRGKTIIREMMELLTK